jgi:hypothetical protein
VSIPPWQNNEVWYSGMDGYVEASQAIFAACRYTMENAEL